MNIDQVQIECVYEIFHESNKIIYQVDIPLNHFNVILFHKISFECFSSRLLLYPKRKNILMEIYQQRKCLYEWQVK